MKSLVVFSVLSVSACSVVVPENGEGSVDLAEFNAMETAITSESFTDLSTLTGNADYVGLTNMQIGVDTTKSYLGDFELSVDFDTTAVSGTMDNFASYAYGAAPETAVMTPVSGDLAVSGSFDDAAILPMLAITGSVSGQVDGTTGSATMNGMFFGTDGDFVMLNYVGDFGGIAIGQPGLALP